MNKAIGNGRGGPTCPPVPRADTEVGPHRRTTSGAADEKRRGGLKLLGLPLIAFVLVIGGAVAQGQQPKFYRVGVITSGGQWYETIDGLRDGLRQLKFEEAKQFNLVIRDTKGDLKAAEEAARSIEQEKVDLIYTTSSVVSLN